MFAYVSSAMHIETQPFSIDLYYQQRTTTTEIAAHRIQISNNEYFVRRHTHAALIDCLTEEWQHFNKFIRRRTHSNLHFRCSSILICAIRMYFLHVYVVAVAPAAVANSELI